MQFEGFLAQKPLYYKAFDPMRMRHAYASIQSKLVLPKIIHILGTNGKGSTGRYLAQMIMQSGASVAHYTSPHITKLNERFWCNGTVCTDEALEKAFETLQGLLDPVWQEALSFFEYTTLLAVVLFGRVDYLVLEAGLGGEYDATAVFDNLLTVVTPIGLDHADFLGETIEEVAATKLRGVQKKALLALQEPAVLAVAETVSTARGWTYTCIEEVVFTSQDSAVIAQFSAAQEVHYLVDNFTVALGALRLLGLSHPVDASAIETIFGRLTRLSDHLYLDVGHNLLAAQKILEYFGKRKVILVYNSMHDKPYEAILRLLKPIVRHVHILPLECDRAVSIEALQDALKRVGLPYDIFTKLKPHETYLVFGSFVVAETFLKRRNE